MPATYNTVTVGDKEITLVGTAHISSQSVEDVRSAVDEHEPERVCVEIDSSRYAQLRDGSSWKNLDVYKVIRRRKGFLLLGNLALSSFQKRMGVDLGTKPGEEMRAAINIAEERDLPYSFCDREIQVTLRRAWAKSSFWGKMKMLAALMTSVVSKEKLTEEDLEQLKEQDALEGMLRELAAYLPSAKEVLIDERDRYLATRIYESPERKIVAVVGAGHVPGIKRWFEKLEAGNAPASLDDIDTIPPRKLVSRILPWIIPAAVVGLITWGFIDAGWQGGLQRLYRWILVNGTLSAVGAIVALAHPVTVVLSFLAAPFTSMNPTVGVGLVSGLIEAVVRKPRVSDLEALQDDIVSLRGFYRNRVTRILLVFFLSSLGSAIGTFIAFPLLFPGVG
ncbi:MAG: TraB family protein [Spirochaetes bacterium]|jgi:pheromone shutdown-related protein TraB|nr:TraB family protein [Spirochaetota bacterium]